jgi:RNA polymerase sigma-70 factor (ECF subfamily)
MITEANFERRTAPELGGVHDNPNRDDAAELVVQARSGSPAAIEQLVERYEHRLFRLAQNILSNHEDAEEVVQNAFLKAFQKLAAFRGDSRFYTWLVRIAVNEALMKIRRRNFREVSIDAPGEPEDQLIPRELKDSGPNPEERHSQEELRGILAATISKLDPGYRIVFRLRDIEGFSTEDTARSLDLSVPAVKTRLRRARSWLRSSLEVYFQTVNGFGRGGRVSLAEALEFSSRSIALHIFPLGPALATSDQIEHHWLAACREANWRCFAYGHEHRSGTSASKRAA